MFFHSLFYICTNRRIYGRCSVRNDNNDNTGYPFLRNVPGIYDAVENKFKKLVCDASRLMFPYDW